MFFYSLRVVCTELVYSHESTIGSAMLPTWPYQAPTYPNNQRPFLFQTPFLGVSPYISSFNPLFNTIARNIPAWETQTRVFEKGWLLQSASAMSTSLSHVLRRSWRWFAYKTVRLWAAAVAWTNLRKQMWAASLSDAWDSAWAGAALMYHSAPSIYFFKTTKYWVYRRL